MRCYRPITITDPGRELQMGDPSLRSGGGAGEQGKLGSRGGWEKCLRVWTLHSVLNTWHSLLCNHQDLSS